MEGSGPRDGAERPASYALPAARGGGPSRPLQVGSLVQRALQEILARGLNDPRYRGLVSILEVRISPDLADATVFVSVLPEEHGKLTIAALDHARGHLASKLRGATALRRIPRLSFRLDDRLKRAAHLEQAIREGLDVDASSDTERSEHTGDTTP
jgi:ribosome-binding factor A